MRWTRETEQTLQGCFEATDCDVLCSSHGGNIDNLTNCIREYVNFCVETVRCFPNDKSWVTMNIKATLNRKQRGMKRS